MNRGIKFKYCWKVEGERTSPKPIAKIHKTTTPKSNCPVYNHHSGSFKYCPEQARREFNTLGSGLIKLFSGIKSVMGLD